MNNIYVDELPESCIDCPCHNGEHGHCKLNGKYVIIYRLFDCPLKLITDRLAEERKKVCDELRRKAEDKYFEFGEDGEVPCGWVISEERLQQIERGE